MGVRSQNVKKLLEFVKPYLRRIVLALVLTVFLTILGMTPPIILKYIVDNIIVGGNWGMLEVMLLISLSIPLLSSGLRIANSYTISFVSNRLILEIRHRIYRHLLSLSMSFYTEMGTGKVMSRIMGDVASVRSLVTRRVLSVVTDFVTFWLAIGLCLSLNWKMGLLLILMLPLYIANYFWFRRGIRSSWRSWRRKMDKVSIGLQERLSGVQLVKSYGRENKENRNFAGDTRDGLNSAMQAAVYQASYSSSVSAVTGFRNTLVFCLGCYFVIQGEMTYGALMAFQAYAMRVFHPVLHLTQTAMEFDRMMVSVDRIFEILDWPIKIKEKAGAKFLPAIEGAVRFDHVWFEYKPGEPILKDICLEVNPGSVVALVGHTGCGKTTLTSLLMRFYDVKEGAIYIDGHDIRDVKIKSLRKQIGQVLQDSVLFNMSIKDNLRYGKMNATDEEVMKAARIAELHEFILGTSGGYDTLIGDEGIKLSVGEKQRLAIARAILTDPGILIMDEATSSLDSLSEALIQKAMASVLKGRTSFVIAHRLSTIVNADLIVVMDQGEIVEVGSHEGLLEQVGGKYRQLYEQQYAGLELVEMGSG